MKTTYRDSGVDIDAGNNFIDKISPFIKKTYRKEVVTDLGGFSGLFAINKDKYKNPVLVGATDGVGTKLNIANLMNKYDTIGQDLVAMCVNDLICCGAEPLFFLDYLATGHLELEKHVEVVKGIANACKTSGAALIGGETAEMPILYSRGDFDLAGFAVGIIDKDKIINGSNISEGDAIIGIKSSGIHSNGYSLVNKLISDHKVDLKLKPSGFDRSLGETILEPTTIYVKLVLDLIPSFSIKGIAHITGGGLLENVPRILPKNCEATIDKSTWARPEIFNWLQNLGDIDEDELLRVFNCGIGLVLVVPDKEKNAILSKIKLLGESAWIIGKITSGDKLITIN